MFNRVVLLAFVVSGSSFFSISAEPPAKTKKLTIEFRQAEWEPAEGLKKADVRNSKRAVYLHPKAEVTLADIQEVVAVKNEDSDQLALSMTLTKEGAEKMHKLTKEHIGKPLAVVVDGEVVFAPTIRSAVSSRIMISGLKEDESKELVQLFEKR